MVGTGAADACICAGLPAIAAAIYFSGGETAAANVANRAQLEAHHQANTAAAQARHTAEMAMQDNIHGTMYGRNMGGVPGAPAPVRFCHWAAPEWGDLGQVPRTTAFEVAALAIALLVAEAQRRISRRQMDLAQAYLDHAEYKWNRFNNNYRPLEIQLLNEVRNTPIRHMDCVGASNRARTSVNSAYANTSGYMARRAKALRSSIDPSLMSMINLKQATMLVDTKNYNLVDEQWFTDYANDKRWNRRSNILNLGRNISSEAMRYGDVARQIYGQLGGQVGRFGGGVMSALGYYGAKQDTLYPSSVLGAFQGNLANIDSRVSSNPTNTVNPSAGED